MRKFSLSIVLIVVLLCLIMRSDTAIVGAKDGISLCVQTVIPSIFPFLFITMLVCNYSEDISVPLLNSICKLTGIPLNAQHILILALIGGYPIGAQAIARSYNTGQITKETSKRLLGFCSNAGPAFVFGLLSTLFKNKYAAVILWLIHIFSALIVGILLPHTDKKQETKATYKHPEKFTNVLHGSIGVMSIICSWVVLFRVLIQLIDCILIMIPPIPRTVIYGILELSNGCIALGALEDEYIRFITASALLSVGGLCVLLQTVSVVDRIGLGLYIPGKIMQVLLSIALSCLLGSLLYNYQPHVPIFVTALIISFGFAVIFRKKSSSFICANIV